MKKTNIVLFWFMNDWGLYGRAYEQIAKTLANHESINSVTCILPHIKSTQNQFFFEKKNISKKLTIISPYWVSINKSGRFYKLWRTINHKFSPIQLVKFYLGLKGYKKDNTIFWAFPRHPYLYQAISAIPHHYLVTQIVDNNSKRDVSNDKAQEITNDYLYFVNMANFVITSSQLNYDFFKQENDNCLLIENGVSPDFLALPTALPFKVKISRPRLGYVGFISQRTDVELMNFIAQNCEDCDLIIAGPDAEGLLVSCNILDKENVHYLGSVAQSQVPELLQSFDICLIPHKDTEYSKSMSPLKLYQYLASGRPIVSTCVAGTDKFSELISLANSYESFITSIYDTLENDSIDNSQRRIDAAKNESWESKVNLMLACINK
ncbi:MAG: glycosyltransferase [Methyloprofundus sp.]|nr:glycosyltransferase [Methyloprofundus sp.]